MDDATMNMLTRLAKAVASQFGENCEVVVHDLTSGDPENTIAAIENGHVSNRSAGHGTSHIALEALKADPSELKDHYSYITQTADGRMLRSSTVYIKDDAGCAEAIFSINYDLTDLMMAQGTINALMPNGGSAAAERIPTNVNDLLEDLLNQSVALIGKPVALMNKEEKVRSIRFLNDAGAMLITKSGDKIARFFGISKYTLYSYLDAGA